MSKRLELIGKILCYIIFVKNVTCLLLMPVHFVLFQDVFSVLLVWFIQLYLLFSMMLYFEFLKLKELVNLTLKQCKLFSIDCFVSIAFDGAALAGIIDFHLSMFWRLWIYGLFIVLNSLMLFYIKRCKKFMEEIPEITKCDDSSKAQNANYYSEMNNFNEGTFYSCSKPDNILSPDNDSEQHYEKVKSKVFQQVVHNDRYFCNKVIKMREESNLYEDINYQATNKLHTYDTAKHSIHELN